MARTQVERMAPQVEVQGRLKGRYTTLLLSVMRREGEKEREERERVSERERRGGGGGGGGGRNGRVGYRASPTLALPYSLTSHHNLVVCFEVIEVETVHTWPVRAWGEVW